VSLSHSFSPSTGVRPRRPADISALRRIYVEVEVWAAETGAMAERISDSSAGPLQGHPFVFSDERLLSWDLPAVPGLRLP